MSDDTQQNFIDGTSAEMVAGVMASLAHVTRAVTVLVFLGRCLSPWPSHALLTSHLTFVTYTEIASLSPLISPDGAHVYGHDSRGVFVTARNAVTGQLGLVQKLDATAFGAGDDVFIGALAMSPDGKHVYSSGYSRRTYSDSTTFIQLFVRDPLTGMLVPTARWDDDTSGLTGLSLYGQIAGSSDGEHVYVMGSKLVIFDRDPSSGHLTFVESNAVEGTEIAVSPDGANVYVRRDQTFSPTYLPPTLFVFDRNAGTGVLTFRESHADVDKGVVVSPDGMHVYAGYAVFERHPGTGSLTFAGPSGGPGCFSPDGTRMYVTVESGIRVYARDLWTGALTLLGGAERPDRENDPGSGAVSPDGRHVYGGSSLWGVALYQRVAVKCGVTPEPSCRGSTTPGVSLLHIDETDNPPYTGRLTEVVRFHLGRGEATDAGALGDPTSTTDYSLCIYAPYSGVLERGFEINIESGNLCRVEAGCWNRTANGVFTFRDSRGRRRGLKQLKLKAGADGEASMSFRVRGKYAAQGAQVPLPEPVLVQVLNSLGECWEQSFSAPLVNSGTRFKAKQ